MARIRSNFFEFIAGQFMSRGRGLRLNKCKNPVITAKYVDELEKMEFASIKDGGYFYIHRSCASWSFGVGQDTATGTLRNLEMFCPKLFHYPCNAAAGGFQVFQSYNCFCKDHHEPVPLVYTDDINYRQCSALGDVGNLMMLNEEERCACLLCCPFDQPAPPKPEKKIFPLALEGNHYVDGVPLNNLHQIKSLQAEFGKPGRSLDKSFDDVKLQPLDPREEAEIYKDGIVWNDLVPPEGFSLVTKEQGVVVLHKKLQRNLQKLGIGGFFVRKRAVRTKDDEIADGVVPKKKPIRRKQQTQT
ncbi:hypothetical protein quinque_011249 [Culex quinquefasciatus]